MMLKALSQQSTMRSTEGCEEWERLIYDPVRATADWPPAALPFTDVWRKGRKGEKKLLHLILTGYVDLNT